MTVHSTTASHQAHEAAPRHQRPGHDWRPVALSLQPSPYLGRPPPPLGAAIRLARGPRALRLL